MKKLITLRILLAVMVVPLLAQPLQAAAGDKDAEFERILNMSMTDLTRESQQVLERRYPDADWEAYDFPSYVHTSESVETGYMIAVKEPDLLENFKCYCFCDAMGHADLRWCFLKEGAIENGFDPHGADCNICYGQAMMALLWQEAGIAPERMTEGYETKFKKLIERFGEGN